MALCLQLASGMSNPLRFGHKWFRIYFALAFVFLTTAFTEKDSFLQNVVFNGAKIETTEFRSFVVVRAQRAQKTFECVGVLIHPKYVLTVGHCLWQSTNHQVGFFKDGQGVATWTNVTRFWRHPRWNGDIDPLDSRPLMPNDYKTFKDYGLLQIPSAPLEAEPLAFADIDPKSSSYLSMVGSEHRHLPSDGRYLGLLPIKQIWQQNGSDVYSSLFRDVRKNFRSGFSKGDSGSPVVISDQGEYYLVGIAFRGGLVQDGPIDRLAGGNMRNMSQMPLAAHDMAIFIDLAQEKSKIESVIEEMAGERIHLRDLGEL